MAYQAVLFDLDGTLLDTNTVHIEAFRRAFEQFGHDIKAERISPEIGRAGEDVLAILLGDDVEESEQKAIQDAVKRWLPKIAEERAPLRVLDGASELFSAIHDRNLKIAIATSAGEPDLNALTSNSGFDVCELADEVTTKDDAENSKPAPDILLAACDKLHIPQSDALFIGDTKWDAISGVKAGITSVGVLECSVYSEQELREAGMQHVFPTLQALLENLDAVLT